jgi:uncharacterized protein
MERLLSNGISVTRTPEGLAAFVLVSNQRAINYPVRDEIMSELRVHGISFGVSVAAVDDLVASAIIDKPVLVAKGLPAQPGIAGRIETSVDLSPIGKPKTLPDGRVDYHSISYVFNVRKGDRLARRIPPVPGSEGQSVIGNPILPPPPADVKLRPGPGTQVSPADPDLLVAQFDGGLWIEKDGTIEVHKEEKILGDIDYKTGDIDFSGDLRISGTVRTGFSVVAKGSLLIEGSVEDCRIKSWGNIVIKGGTFGAGTGSIECKGSITVRHVENFRIKADGDVTVVEDIVHGTVTGGGCVSAKAILGGTIASAFGVEADTIGSAAEVKTVIDIGKKYEQLQQRYDLLKKVAALATDCGNAKERLFQFVRDALDEKGFLSADAQKMLAAMKLKTLELNRMCNVTQAELEALETLKINGEEPYVKARAIFPNTIVKFGVGEQLIREPLEAVRLSPVEKGSTVTLQRESSG